MEWETFLRGAFKRFSETKRAWGLGLLMVGSLVGMYHSSLGTHMSFARYPLVFNDDSRQYVWPFLLDRQPSRAQPDLIYDYRRASMPVGYKALYQTYSCFGDPRTLSKTLPYILLLLTLLGAGAASWRLGGPAAAWCTAAFCLASGIFLDRLSGGHPRAFAFPLIAWMAAALAYGRTRGLAVLTLLGAAFYPVTAVLGGLSLAAATFLDIGPVQKKGDLKPLGVVAATGVLCVLLVFPTWYAMRAYAPRMSASLMEAYPEYGPGGRYKTEADRPPYQRLGVGLARYTRETLEGTGRPWFFALRQMGAEQRHALRGLFFLLFLAGFLRLLLGTPAVRRLLILPAAMFAIYPLVKAAAPSFYLPQRYVIYLIPIMALVLVPASLGAVVRYVYRGKYAERWGSAAAVALCVLQLVFLGGRGPTQVGYHIQIPQGEWVYPFIATLPSDSLIAGWPGPISVVDNIPYISARAAFLSLENHEVYFRGYADQMRERMRALIAALYATDTDPLIRLRDEFGVTHLILKEGFYDSPGRYFKPFSAEAAQAYALAQASAKGLEIPRQIAFAQVFNDGRYSVLDLGKIR